ncbi:mycothiol system anti-sigma-R factor [Georgenia wangjunii]|uniref:mycothiol system anti-sigma-R factor n=1 Tax=Georgenia wangjunii TaxID=3117730 RepID=UPI002F263AA8
MADQMDLARRGWGPDLPLTDEAGPCRCEELLEHLYEFLDSEMSDTQRARLRDHVVSCPTCQEATDAEQHLRAIIRRSCAEVAPQNLRLRVVAQIEVLRGGGPAR